MNEHTTGCQSTVYSKNPMNEHTTGCQSTVYSKNPMNEHTTGCQSAVYSKNRMKGQPWESNLLIVSLDPFYKHLYTFMNIQGGARLICVAEKVTIILVFFDSSLTVKAVPHESVIRTGQPQT